jgi:hypothetical protein
VPRRRIVNGIPHERDHRFDFDFDVGTLVAAQWPGSPRGPTMGWPALAHALLANAVFDAGLAARRGPGGLTPSMTASARAYLLEATDGTEPLPLAVACDLARLDVMRVRAVVRLGLP